MNDKCAFHLNSRVPDLEHPSFILGCLDFVVLRLFTECRRNIQNDFDMNISHLHKCLGIESKLKAF